MARSVEVATVYGEVQEKDLKAVRILDLLEAGAAALGQGTPQPPHPGQPLQRGDRLILRLPAPPAASTAAPELRQARKVLQRPRVDLDAVASVYTEACHALGSQYADSRLGRSPTFVARSCSRPSSLLGGWSTAAQTRGTAP